MAKQLLLQEREQEKDGRRQKQKQTISKSYRKSISQQFQRKQKSLPWNYGERGCFLFPFALKFPFETVSHQHHQNLGKHRGRGQTWTRFIMKWGRKQVRTAFSLALPSSAMKGFQSSNYKSKLKFFCESLFEGAAILPFKAFPQSGSWIGEGWFFHAL